MAFADPRDGDLEDDASSTSRHSLLGHASHILLEISLPKLALAALLLLVVPAVLIGAAPKVALWFADQVWARVSDAGRWITVIAVLLLAAGILWRWSARLLRAVERNFWALNAALVQPLYMAVRELVGLALEFVAPTRDFAAARRLAGLVAGSLLAVGAALVALAVGPLPSVIVDDLSPAGLLRAAGDSLSNGIWAIAVYLMVGAPAWSVAEALAGSPQEIDSAIVPGTAAWRIAHLSDIHVVGDPYGFRLECGRDGPRGNARLDAALAVLAAEDARERLDWIMVTGDVTDAGRNAEYIAFEEALARHPALRDRVLVIPGNHDVNIVDRANPARLELPIAPGGSLRRLRMLAATARLQGHRVHVMDRAARALGPTLNDWLAADGRGAALARFMDDGGIRAGLAAREVWNQAWPMVVPPPAPDGLGVILLDSNAETHFSFTNALGLVGMDQMRAAEAAMAQFPRARWLVALHHHLMEYPRPGAALAERIGTALVNGHWVLGRLRRVAARVLVLHGHRHFDWMGTSGALRIASAPSPVMGAPDRPEGRFWIHALAPSADGGLAMLAPRPVAVPEPRSGA
ncbi:metallophosphoesterase [Roseomonas sp. CECT 9278]|uniref:metallophosphoesterase family protein n=1 Tax=Roseomonas sp. CECT 9278 TaxID=2845823 RepID=UPI001E41D368|nr:metallophosphoesterase [Roseomonas sp. CECT 9278]CAH0145078.1 3',5'-cyclic adenosine monophosphate phosphodiesterase CpdA [Roseomonas sp. CECT 9278]